VPRTRFVPRETGGARNDPTRDRDVRLELFHGYPDDGRPAGLCGCRRDGRSIDTERERIIALEVVLGPGAAEVVRVNLAVSVVVTTVRALLQANS